MTRRSFERAKTAIDHPVVIRECQKHPSEVFLNITVALAAIAFVIMFMYYMSEQSEIARRKLDNDTINQMLERNDGKK